MSAPQAHTAGARPTGPEQLRVGIVGCGWAAEHCHLPALSRLQDVQVVALADVDAGRAARLARDFHVAATFPGLPELLAQSDVEVVAICTPPNFHAEVAETALSAGVHVLVEKPIAATLADADRVVAAAAKAPGRIMVAQNVRWHRQVRRARALIAGGAIGQIVAVQTAFTSGDRFGGRVPEWSRWRRSGGGVLLDTAVHHVDAWRYLLGVEVEEVMAYTRTAAYEDQSAALVARLEGGVLATALFSQETADNNVVEVYGTKGRIHLSLFRFDGLELFRTGEGPGQISARLAAIVQFCREFPVGVRNLRHGGEFPETYTAEWRHFADAIRSSQPPETDAASARATLAVALAAAASLERGIPVRVAEIAGAGAPTGIAGKDGKGDGPPIAP